MFVDRHILQNKHRKKSLLLQKYWVWSLIFWGKVWEHLFWNCGYLERTKMTLLLFCIPWVMQWRIEYPPKKSLWWRNNLNPKSTSMSNSLVFPSCLFFMKTSRTQGRSSWLKDKQLNSFPWSCSKKPNTGMGKINQKVNLPIAKECIIFLVQVFIPIFWQSVQLQIVMHQKFCFSWFPCDSHKNTEHNHKK